MRSQLHIPHTKMVPQRETGEHYSRWPDVCCLKQNYQKICGHMPFNQQLALETDVITRGDFYGDSGGRSPPVKISAHVGGLSPPKTLALTWLFRVYWPCFQSAMINYALLYGY